MKKLAHLKRPHFRVKFNDPSIKKVYEVVVKNVETSHFMGMIVLDGFVFRDQTKFVLLPEEDEARKRFGKTEKVHIPYQHLVLIEEIEAEESDLHHLPFIRSAITDTDKPTGDH